MTSELLIMANSISPLPKKSIKLQDIRLWHSRMRYLGYKSVTTLKNLRSRIKLYGTILAELYGDC